MTFLDDLFRYRSVALVGMAKNTGKTTCLNYVLDALKDRGDLRPALTSIGVDGEERDVLYDTPKPRITLRRGTIFMTSEKHYADKELEAEILELSDRSTALGRLITARAITDGRVILSGPSDTLWLKSEMNKMSAYGSNFFLIDGALSRLSLASPAVSEALVLSTGAACSTQLDTLVRRTRHLCRLIHLPACRSNLSPVLSVLPSGVYAVDGQRAQALGLQSAFHLDASAEDWLTEGSTLFLSGALTDPMLKVLSQSPRVEHIRLILRDFTRCFAQASNVDRFLRRGGQIEVLDRAQLVAVCSNPCGPDGAHYDPVRLRDTLAEAIQIPVIDICLEKKIYA